MIVLAGLLLAAPIEAQHGVSTRAIVAHIEAVEVPLVWEEHPGIGQRRLLGIKDDPHVLIELVGPPDNLHGMSVSFERGAIENHEAFLSGGVLLRAAFPEWDGFVDWYDEALRSRESSVELRRCGIQVDLLKARAVKRWSLHIWGVSTSPCTG